MDLPRHGNHASANSRTRQLVREIAPPSLHIQEILGDASLTFVRMIDVWLKAALALPRGPSRQGAAQGIAFSCRFHAHRRMAHAVLLTVMRTLGATGRTG